MVAGKSTTRGIAGAVEAKMEEAGAVGSLDLSRHSRLPIGAVEAIHTPVLEAVAPEMLTVKDRNAGVMVVRTEEAAVAPDPTLQGRPPLPTTTRELSSRSKRATMELKEVGGGEVTLVLEASKADGEPTSSSISVASSSHKPISSRRKAGVGRDVVLPRPSALEPGLVGSR